MRRRLPILAALLATVGCGPGPAAAPDPAEEYPAPLVTAGDGELVVTCGGGAEGWPVSVMSTGLPGVLTPPEAQAMFTAFLADPQYGEEMRLSFLAAGAEGTTWKVLRDGGDTLTLALGRWTAEGPGEGALVMGVERREAGWGWAGGGECHLTPALDAGSTWVTLSQLDGPLDRGSTRPQVGVTERACTSGRDPTRFLHEPTVVETDDTVTVYWTSTPVGGAANCIGTSPTPAALSLRRPLGERQLLDGSTYPATPIGATLTG